MNSRERVLCALRHCRPDRTPKGDLAIEARLQRVLAEAGGYAGDDANARQLAALRFLGADIAHVHDYPVQAIGSDAQAGRFSAARSGRSSLSASTATP